MTRYSAMTGAGVIVYVTTLAALVALAFAHGDTEPVMVLAGPVVAALLVSGQIGARSDRQDEALAQITKQTNGVLDARIKDGILAALRDADASSPPPQRAQE